RPARRRPAAPARPDIDPDTRTSTDHQGPRTGTGTDHRGSERSQTGHGRTAPGRQRTAPARAHRPRVGLGIAGGRRTLPATSTATGAPARTPLEKGRGGGLLRGVRSTHQRHQTRSGNPGRPGCQTPAPARTRHSGPVQLTVTDDGCGGADPEVGTGLYGLWDRLDAVDGSLTVHRPPGK